MRKLLIAFRVFPYYWSSNYWQTNFKKVLLSFFSIFGIVWLFIETANHFHFELGMPETTPFSFIVMLFGAFFLSVIFNIPKLIHEVEVADTDIKIEIIVSDFFKLKGDKVIATNSTFDTTHKDNFISPKSLQGQFFKKYYKDISHLDNDLVKGLSYHKPIATLNRKESKTNKYSIGTVAKITHSIDKPFWNPWSKDIDFRSYWIALADVNEYGKPSSNLENLQVSLISLWDFIATKGHLENLVIPILGSGRTGINEKRERILQEIIFSFVAFASEKKVSGNKLTEKLTIAIHPTDLLKHKIDFNELIGFVEYTCKYKSSKNFGRSKEI